MKVVTTCKLFSWSEAPAVNAVLNAKVGRRCDSVAHVGTDYTNPQIPRFIYTFGWMVNNAKEANEISMKLQAAGYSGVVEV